MPETGLSASFVVDRRSRRERFRARMSPKTQWSGRETVYHDRHGGSTSAKQQVSVRNEGLTKTKQGNEPESSFQVQDHVWYWTCRPCGSLTRAISSCPRDVAAEIEVKWHSIEANRLATVASTDCDGLLAADDDRTS